MDPFVHLHVHSEYSLLDGASRISDLAQEAAAHQAPALALTDHGNLFGAIEFYKACQAAGVKPIIGCEVYLAPGDLRDHKAASAREASTHFLLLAKNETGYQNLLKLVSIAHLEGYHYKPRVDKAHLAQYGEGLIGTSACLKGEVAQHILAGNEAAAKRSIEDFKKIFAPGDFYLEMHNHGIPQQKIVNDALTRFSKELDVKLVAANDVHYVKREHASAHDVLLCIGTNSMLSDEKRMRYPGPEFYYKSAEEMAALFPDHPEALKTTLEIAEKCNLKLELGTNKFPHYQPPAGQTREEYFRTLCQEGLQRRFGARAEEPELKERLEYEIGVLEKQGFLSYFLIVWDFIHYAKSNGIPVGPGRGSAAGSLIAYALGITDLDPLRYSLFFERFLNPERVSPPDIDVDFCYNRRPEVINYVRKKYGEKSVAQIITFGTLGAKMAVRDVARVMGLSYGEADRLAKMIPFDPKMTLEKALKDNPEFKKAYDEEERTKELIDYALTLEGLSRQAGVHAAGVVISDQDLTNFVPLTRDDSEGIVTQYEMNSLGEVGMLKMDFLGLKTLTVIQDALRFIEESSGLKMEPSAIPLDDPKTYELLTRAQNVGVFQVESAGMCDACRRIKPKCVEDIIALVALYRPGPMEFIPLYADRKLGKVPVEYDHPLLEPILKETYGIMVYQEQVMQAAQILAGYTLGGADLLRRAMGKKKPEEMAKQRAIFVAGAERVNGIKKDQADKLFDVLDKFAGYGFNKAHAACYGVLAVQTGWLKANYPVEFLAALLSNDLDNTDKIAVFIAEAKALNIQVLGPDINESRAVFMVKPNTIRFGLAAIKNVGFSAVEEILKARDTGGPFTSIRDLCNRVESRALNKKFLESLVKTGAFDSLGLPRAQLITQVDSALGQASTAARERASGQTSLLDMLAPEEQSFQSTAVISAEIPEWPVKERLTYEKELLGFYLSGHPLDEYLAELQALQLTTISDLANLEDGTDTRLAGLVSKIEVRLSQKDKRPWAKVLFEDQTGGTEIFIFGETYAGLTKAIQPGDILAISGSVDRREEPAKLRASEIISLEDARTKLYRALVIHLPLEEWDADRLHSLHEAVLAHPGSLRLFFRCESATRGRIHLEAGEAFGVEFTGELLSSLRAVLGRDAYELIASKALPEKRRPAWRNSGRDRHSQAKAA